MDNKIFLNNIVYENRVVNKFRFWFISFFNAIIIAIFYILSNNYAVYGSVISEIIVLSIAVITLGLFYTNKLKYIEKYGKKEAYHKAFYNFHVTSMPLIYVSALHPLLTLVGQSGFEINIIGILIRIFGLYFIITGIVLHRRSIKLFGLDNLFMYYVYYPELGEKKESVIHSMLRHPIYSAMSRISIGFGLLVGTPSSICCCVILPIMQLVWLKCYEEKDLLARFKSEYKNYTKQTPAIFVKIKDIHKFWKFLLGR